MNKQVKACPECDKTLLKQLKPDLWKCHSCKKTVPRVILRDYKGTGGIRQPPNETFLVPEPQQYLNKLNEITNFEHKVFFTLLYLTGCRVTEILGNGSNINCLHKEQFIRKEIKIRDDLSIPILLIVEVPTLKKKRFGQIPTKPVPIFLNKEPEMSQIIIDHLNTIVNVKAPIFGFGKRRAQQLIKKYFGDNWYLHFIRKSRITHLVEIYGWNDWEVKKFINWSDTRPMTSYVNLSIKDIVKKMQ